MKKGLIKIRPFGGDSRSIVRVYLNILLLQNPKNELWYEGEVCCLFSDSNLGKSIYAVQMADQIASTRCVLLVDCELTDKQFQMRYTDQPCNPRRQRL